MINKKFAICCNNTIQNSVDVKTSLGEILRQKKVSFNTLDIDDLKSGCDFAFVIGGDGTILKSARFFAKYQTPVFGINLGRLGFLSQASQEKLSEAVDEILAGKYYIDERIMLQSGENLALNDFVIKGNSQGRTSRLTLKINGKAVCDYLADGIIVSTPTGSTAYGLSAGGPVVVPDLNAFIIVPICPHTLTARPLVIPDSEEISISSGESRKEYVISTDGQEFFETASEIKIKKSEYCAKLALLDNADFYSILRSKLFWGTSPAKICR